ncbi:K(+)-transporting ATPase subunit F [soil metagenome]
MLKKVLISFALLVVGLSAGLAIFISSRPDTFVVQRSVTIKSPPAPIYPLIADFHKWTKWSPYERMDPKMERKYEGSQSGTGAKYVWEGNEKAGSGTMQITEATPPSKVAIKLDFSKPFEGHNLVEFKLEPHGDDETTVTWSMSGPSPTMMKVVGLFMNMDEMIGKDFDEGLDNLKSVAENTEAKKTEAEIDGLKNSHVLNSDVEKSARQKSEVGNSKALKK